MPRITGREWLDRGLQYRHPLPDGREMWHRAGFWKRPPIAAALQGRSSSAAGRGHRRTHTAEAKAARVALAWRAYQLRRQGMSIRTIASILGVGKTTVGRWLFGVEPGGLEYAEQRVEVRYVHEG